MRKNILVFVLFACSSLAGCSKDAEINTAMKDLNEFTTQLVQRIESAQGSVEGIDEAQRFFDSKKQEMQKKLGVLKGARGFQVSDETKKSMTESITKNMTSLASLQIKYVARSMKDPNHKSKFEKLVKDYRDLLIS